MRLVQAKNTYDIIVCKKGEESDAIERGKLLVSLANSFEEDIDIVSDRYIIDAKSIMGIFSLNLCKPLKIVFHSNDAHKIMVFAMTIDDYNNIPRKVDVN